jgi:hypothetical protein
MMTRTERAAAIERIAEHAPHDPMGEWLTGDIDWDSVERGSALLERDCLHGDDDAE